MRPRSANANLDQIFDALNYALSIANSLESFGDAFLLTGNDRVGDRLLEHSEALRGIAADIRSAVGAEAVDRLHQAEEATCNMMNGILTVIEMQAKRETQ